ncbi:MAG: plastocyanin/azurin family copper-binding protein [Solirubrobacterales bacterium]
MKKASVLLVAIALALFGLAACGDDDDGGGETTVETTTTETAAGGAGGGVEITTSEGISYDQNSAETAAGAVTVSYDNQADIPHDVTIEDESGTELGGTDLITASSAETTVDLQPGTYTFYCSVPGHRDDGMEGTLTVD